MNECMADFGPAPLRIGKLVIDPPLVLAPMAGVTDEIYRRIMADFGAGLVTTEMISVEGLRRNQPATWKLISGNTGLRVPLAVQIFGGNPAAAAEAARLVEGKGASMIDINAGCPVRKVVRQGAGAALLKDPGCLGSLVESVKKAVGIPVTVKVRVGWDEGSTQPVALAKLLESAGADAITVHARTAVQHYSGRADWTHIQRVKAAVRIPVIGNGDIASPWLADRMLHETRCDAVMVGRGTMGNPWLVSSIAAHWGRHVSRKGKGQPDWEEFCNTACGHVEAADEKGPRSVGYLRKIFMWYSKGCPDSSRLRANLLATGQATELQRIFRAWVDENEARPIPVLPQKVPSGQRNDNLREHDWDGSE